MSPPYRMRSSYLPPSCEKAEAGCRNNARQEHKAPHTGKVSMNNSSMNHLTGQEIAVISMAGRFPGAQSVEEFWSNLRAGVESISTFTDEELLSAGVSQAQLRDPNYVRAKGVLEDIELFDGSFFGFNPREAEVTDPQHRLFL